MDVHPRAVEASLLKAGDLVETAVDGMFVKVARCLDLPDTGERFVEFVADDAGDGLRIYDRTGEPLQG